MLDFEDLLKHYKALLASFEEKCFKLGEAPINDEAWVQAADDIAKLEEEME